ncbi:hypothetical protein MHB65_19955 [Lysinibacillus sp. FSL K6-0075]|uniref:hypothetical protein n=1 Tax=Lysinibacillus sp. FSL K6-0075 TaxID=2921415 RepID=UPI00315822AE
MSVELKGLKDLAKNSKELQKKLNKTIRRSTKAAALKLLADAVELAPVYQGQIDENGELLKDEEGNVVKTHTGGKLKGSGTVVLNNKTVVAESDENGNINAAKSNSSSARDMESVSFFDVGFNTTYAEKQHDHEEYRHIDGQADYLMQPMRELKSTFEEQIIKDAKKTMEKETRKNRTNN